MRPLKFRQLCVSWIRRGILLHACIAALLLLSAGQATLGQTRRDSDAISVSTQIGEQRIYLGDKQLLRFNVTGSREIVPPKLPSSPACEVEYIGALDQSSSTTIIINGRMSQQSTVQLALQYQLSPTQVGIVKIPSLTILIEGKPFQTEPVEFEVVAVPTSPDSSLKLVCDRRRVYVGEPVPVTLVWRFAGDVQRAQFDAPSLANAEFLPGPDPAPPGAYNADPRFVRLKFGSFEHNARMDDVPSQGKRTREIRMDLVLLPSHAGDLEVPPVRVLFDAVVGRRAPRPMEFSFGDIPVTARQIAISDPLKLTVLDLPAAGRPANFSGLIGSFKLAAAVDQKEASVGEPVNLRVTVTGTHPLSRVPPLDLSSQKIAQDFRVPRDPVLATQGRASVVFDTSIRARRAGSMTIPSVELNYFDTAAGAYKVASSSPIAINVADSPTVGLPDDFADSGKASTPATPDPDQIQPQPMRRSLSELPTTLAWNPLVESSRTTLIVLAALLAVPPFAGLTISVVRQVRHRSSPSVVRRRAYRTFNRRVAASVRSGTGVQTGELSAAARAFIGDALADGKELTSNEAVELIRSRDPRFDTASLERTLSTLDAARFAPAGRLPDGSDARDEIRSVIHELHRSVIKVQA